MKSIRIPAAFTGIVLTLIMLASVTACSKQDGKTPPSASIPSVGKAIDNSSAEITTMTQEYFGDSIAEVLMISYDVQQPALEEYGWKNPEIDSLNNAVKFGVQQIYNSFVESGGDGTWIEIRSYPFTSEDYLQIVTTCCTYPSYGTDGDLSSYNFDRKENRFLSVDDALEKLKLDRRSVAGNVREMAAGYYAQADGGLTAGEVSVDGFLFVKVPSGYVTQLLVQVDLTMKDGDVWKTFAGYTPELNEFIPLNSTCLFDPSQMDQMEPPLSYQMSQEFTPDGLTLQFDADGLEVVTPGYEYLLDGLVYFSIETLLPADYSREAVLGQIKSLEGEDIRLTTLSESEKHSALLGYPAWLGVYESGSNEDAMHCVDLYVQTDVADFRLHISVPLDYELDYHDEIGRRLASVFWDEY